MTTTSDAPRSQTRDSRHGEVLDLLRQMSMEVHAYLSDVGRAAGIAPVDMACIGVVRQAERAAEPLSAGTLGHRLGLSPAATTALLDRMSRHELIRRERSIQDARVVHVRLTDRARELATASFHSLNDQYAAALAQRPRLAGQLGPLLRELVDATEQARDLAATESLRPGPARAHGGEF